MSEAAVKSRQFEAAKLYERGVAAARSGQRRLAAGLLSRAVQYDPRHEQAWLWLSGVLDDPNQIAFCLRSALTINPNNQRAHKGLAWLEQRTLVQAPAPPPGLVIPTRSLAPVAADEAAEAAEAPPEPWWRRVLPAITETTPEPAPHTHESWWVHWRRSSREMGRARLLMWLVPILLLVLTLGLNWALRDAVVRNAEIARALAAPPVALEPGSEPTVVLPTPTPEPILQRTVAEAEDAQVLAYLATMTPLREQLSAAVETYRGATSQPGNSSVAHAAAARKLRTQVEGGYNALVLITPPPSLAEAHARYLAGLKEELAALDDILEFYGSFSVQLANRATLRMDDAGKQLARARTMYAQRQNEAHARAVPPHAAR